MACEPIPKTAMPANTAVQCASRKSLGTVCDCMHVGLCVERGFFWGGGVWRIARERLFPPCPSHVWEVKRSSRPGSTHALRKDANFVGLISCILKCLSCRLLARQEIVEESLMWFSITLSFIFCVTSLLITLNVLQCTNSITTYSTENVFNAKGSNICP